MGAAEEGVMSEPDAINCEEALRRLLAFIDRELSGHDFESMERHLLRCRSCFSRMEFESRLKQQLSALASEDVPPFSRDRIRELMSRF